MRKLIPVICFFFLFFLFITSLSFAQWENPAVEIHAPDGDGLDEYGHSVDISGNFAIVGAPFHDHLGPDSGAAYVWQKTGDQWVFGQELLALDGNEGDELGYSVAITVDFAVVGARMTGDKGAAYVFRKNGPIWVEEQKLIASDASIGDRFGSAVVASGNAILVGAPHANNNEGAVYVFRHNGQSWIQETKITLPSGTTNSFGGRIDLRNNVAVIGDPINNVNGSVSGAAYVYRKIGVNWIQEQMLDAMDGAAGDNFGMSVSIADNLIAVGAKSDDDNGIQSGSAYVFRYNGQTWTQEAKLLASDGVAGDVFGFSIATDGDMVVVGAPKRNNVEMSLPNFGGIYVYRYQAGAWVEEAFLLPATTWFNDEFGFSVAASGNTVLGGSHGDDFQGMDSGNAFIFEGEPIATECTGDIDGNNIVDIQDFLALLAAWGPNPGHAADFNNDGVVDIQDFLDLLAAWGPCP